jgi:hypothetical protein
MPATGRAPLDRDVTQIYLYLSTDVMRRIKKIEVPEDIRVDKLTGDEERQLKELKSWIFRTRGGKIRNPVLEAIDEVFSATPKQLNLL